MKSPSRLVGALAALFLLAAVACGTQDEAPPAQQPRATKKITTPKGWSPTGSMTTTRFGHAAVLLPDGKVFATGGCDKSPDLSAIKAVAPGSTIELEVVCSGEGLNSGEIFDPATGKWTATRPSKTIRTVARAALVPPEPASACGKNCGKVLVMGIGTEPELFDPASGKWEAVPAPKWVDGDLISLAGDRQVCTLAPCGKVLAVGRDAPGNSAAELFEPATATWRAVAAPPVFLGLLGFSTSLLPTGEILVTGGQKEKPKADPAVPGGRAVPGDPAVYNPGKDSWTVLEDTGSAFRSGASATVLTDGRVLVAGGTQTLRHENLASAELIDVKNGQAKPARSMSQARRTHVAVLLGDGKVLVMGGRPTLKTAEPPEPDVPPLAEIYDPATGNWRPGGVTAYRGPYRKARHPPFTATTLSDGRVLVVGGVDHNDQVLATAEIYTP